ncbi:MAG: hypothetical protein ACE5F3_05125 [Mariprofundaceae bacterium]
MNALAGLIRRTGVGQSTLLLVVFIVAASLVLDVLVHRLLGEPMIEPFILADTLIASVIAAPICYALLHMLVRLDVQREALVKASEEIRTLEGLLPVCAGCKKVRDDDGFWHQVDAYIRQHSHAEITHSLCPDCATEARKTIPAEN